MPRVPVVAFDIAGAAEVIIDVVTGRLVPWRDTEAMTASVLSLLDQRGHRLRLGAAAQSDA